MSVYRVAIDQTTEAIDRRAKYYRNLIVSIVSIGMGAIILAAFTSSWSPLTGFLLFFPACGAYFFCDHRLLNQWRLGLFAVWMKNELDFQAFFPAMNALPTLPKGSLESMLATLPLLKADLFSEQQISSPTRELVADLLMTKYAFRSDSLALKTAAYVMLSALLILSVEFQIWQPLVGILVLAGIPIMQKGMRLRRINKMKENLRRVSKLPDFNREAYLEFVHKLSQPPIPAAEIEQLLQSQKTS